MRACMALTFILALAGCASQPQHVACTEPRPQVCTLEYAPTCAELRSGEYREYSSPCNACADDQVVAYDPGPCPE